MRLPLIVALFAVAAATPVFAGRHGPSGSPFAPSRHVLVVTVTKEFRHEDSIPLAERLLAEFGRSGDDYDVDYVRTDADMAAKMTPSALNRCDGVIFASTTGDLPLPDRDAFLRWIAAGHAFIGIHAAADTFHGYPPYLEMLGGEFKTHGPQTWVTCNVEDRSHPATRDMGAARLFFDEIYQFDRFDRAKVHPLLSLDRHPNEGTPGYYPIAWCRSYGKGRVFYTALGHRPDVWESPVYQQHLRGGIRWALGEENDDTTPHPTGSEANSLLESKTHVK
jgi:type 1 glutamine amidotransferase